MVEQAAEAIVAAAVRGLFLPGDRLVEAEIARDLGISRVPVREALRLLESQGIVASTPYKGMRLMQVSNAGVASLMRLRLALESLAVQEALRASGGAERFARMSLAAEVYAQACRLGDPAPIVLADEDFHAELCRASGNAPLLALWQSLARQLAVIWGLAQQGGPRAAAEEEHRTLVAAMEAGQEAVALATLDLHINWHRQIDFEQVVAERRLRPAGL